LRELSKYARRPERGYFLPVWNESKNIEEEGKEESKTSLSSRK
jgi:hypothetical protein